MDCYNVPKEVSEIFTNWEDKAMDRQAKDTFMLGQ